MAWNPSPKVAMARDIAKADPRPLSPQEHAVIEEGEEQ